MWTTYESGNGASSTGATFLKKLVSIQFQVNNNTKSLPGSTVAIVVVGGVVVVVAAWKTHFLDKIWNNKIRILTRSSWSE